MHKGIVREREQMRWRNCQYSQRSCTVCCVEFSLMKKASNTTDYIPSHYNGYNLGIMSCIESPVHASFLLKIALMLKRRSWVEIQV